MSSGVRRLLLSIQQGIINKTGKVTPFKMPSTKELEKKATNKNK